MALFVVTVAVTEDLTTKRPVLCNEAPVVNAQPPLMFMPSWNRKEPGLIA